jgi:2,4-dienoyl-CoA reductase-like NADH-dependent reductase (Old Yellow Enzyme family)
VNKPQLFSPLRVRGATFRNRVLVSPMCQYQAVEGHMQEWHFAHHARFALGGVGAAIAEATAVTRDGRITAGCAGIYEDAQMAGWRRITGLYREQGVLSGIQLGHAGRKASTARPWEGAGPLTAESPDAPWQTMAPSALAARPGWHVPHALTGSEILQIVEAFRQAAYRSYEAGFDFIEIHGAHGYLIHSFMSPLSNIRTDEFGGSLENRMRFPLMVARAVREASSEDRPIFYRASVVDDAEGGLAVEDTVELARRLKTEGIDVLDCSAGGIVGPVALGNLKPRPGFQVPLAEAVRAGADILTVAVGLIIEPQQAEAIVADGKADLIALGRELIADPNWVYHAAQELGVADPEAVLPPQYSFYLTRRKPLLADS